MTKNAKWNDLDGNRLPCLREDCDEPILWAGYCSPHYYQQLKELNGKQNLPRVDENGIPIPCDFEACERARKSRGLCQTHSMQRANGIELFPVGPNWMPCRVNGCRKQHTGRSSLCGDHTMSAKRYGLTADEFVEVWADRTCSNLACRETAKRMHVDHDHSCCEVPPFCGKCIRGLLCQSCNTALGHVYDSKQKLQGLIEYLESWENREVVTPPESR